MLAQHIAQHGQHQRDRQGKAPGDRGKTFPGRGFGRIERSIGIFGFVAGIAHGAAQQSFHGRVLACTCGHGNARRFGGEIDTGRLHAGHPQQGFFHPADARGAGHTPNANVQGALRVRVR